jgi:FRG domain
MPFVETRVHNWKELHEILFKDTWQEGIRRHRSSYAFRGVSHFDFKLSTSLIRLGASLGADEGAAHSKRLEQGILRAFKKYAYTDSFQNYNEWFWLTLAQHHGLPTRLLDWTNSPLVALHFATDDLSSYDVDGAVWCVHIWDTHELVPQNFKDILNKNYAYGFTIDMLHEIAPKLPDLDQIASYGGDFMIFFEPPSLDSRIANQFAFFSVMPDPNKCVDDWLETRPNLYQKVIIPAGLKWEIRNKLDQMNITERVLFPGLDGLTKWINRYYSPYPPNTGSIEILEFP